MSTLFETSVSSIDEAYRHLGHTLGWRFLTGPKATLAADVDMAFITLNPGGDRELPDHPRKSCESGNAYLTETWPGSARGTAPLQRQVQMLFTRLIARLGEKRPLHDFLNTRVMSGYFIPFRSRSIAELPHRKESSQFASRLWSNIFGSWMPKCILTMDTETYRAIGNLLSGRPSVRTTDSLSFPTGWGDLKAESMQLTGLREDGPVTIARIPHLSRFRLFGNPIRAPQLNVVVAHLAAAIDPRCAA
jgi:hypothetical protein